MNSQTVLFGLVLLATLIIGWVDSSNYLNEISTSTPTILTDIPAIVAPSSESPLPCAMTVPNGSTPPNERPLPLHHHGNSSLWTVLGASGVTTIQPRDVQADDTLKLKAPWWRAVSGDLAIEGRRLDAPALPLRAQIPEGPEERVLQTVVMLFPTEGCWEVTGKVGTASLTFVTYVVKVPDCEVTLPNGRTPLGEKPSPDFYGNGKLWTGLWPDGVVLTANENVESDGYFGAKFWWWRHQPGSLMITGRRLDNYASPPLRAQIPEGYDGYFQTSAIFFSGEGCWEVTGRVSDDSLTFVTLVVRIHHYPWRTQN
jgi:hypothetical protein